MKNGEEQFWKDTTQIKMKAKMESLYGKPRTNRDETVILEYKAKTTHTTMSIRLKSKCSWMRFGPYWHCGMRCFCLVLQNIESNNSLISFLSIMTKIVYWDMESINWLIKFYFLLIFIVTNAKEIYDNCCL